MKIVITGGAGLLGQYLNIALSQHHSILTLYHNIVRNTVEYNSVRADINNYTEIKSIFSTFRPETVVHTAAVSGPLSVSNADINYVQKTNTASAAKLAELCTEYNSKLIYTSTDLVYDGNQGSMLKEYTELNPVSLYAETKLKGEEKIRENCDDHIILRTALLYGVGLNKTYNHFHQVYLNLKDGVPAKLFTDQFRTPLELREAADIINVLLSKDVKGETINFGGRERVSRYDLGEILCETAGFDKHLLEPLEMSDVADLPAVKDVSMDTSKLQSYGIKQKSIEESISDILNKF